MRESLYSTHNHHRYTQPTSPASKSLKMQHENQHSTTVVPPTTPSAKHYATHVPATPLTINIPTTTTPAGRPQNHFSVLSQLTTLSSPKSGLPVSAKVVKPVEIDAHTGIGESELDDQGNAGNVRRDRSVSIYNHGPHSNPSNANTNTWSARWKSLTTSLRPTTHTQTQDVVPKRHLLPSSWNDVNPVILNKAEMHVQALWKEFLKPDPWGILLSSCFTNVAHFAQAMVPQSFTQKQRRVRYMLLSMNIYMCSHIIILVFISILVQ